MTTPAPSPARRLLVAATFVATVVFVWFRGLGAPLAPPEPERFDDIAFREVGAEVGMRFRHRAPTVDPKVAHIEPQIAGTGAAVSIADANGDGWPDVYAVTSRHGEPNALFVNRRDGTFEERAAEAGLADLNRDGVGCSMGSVWADVDGDGREDVFVYKWGKSQLFLNRGDLRFEDVTAGSGLDRWTNCNAATWFDYDRDGLVDLYVAGYYDEAHDMWNLDTTAIMHDSFEFAKNGGANYLYRNRGDGTFEDVTERVGAASRRWTYAAVSADFDRDGWPDLYLANDYGTEELYLNRGGERLELAADVGLDGESKSGMCVALGNVANDGRLAVFVTNISRRGYLFQGNNLRLNMMPELGSMLQVAEGPVADCGWAWGAQFGDLDDDGYQDLVVVNGFVSADEDREYWYQMSKIGTGTGGLVADAANWPAFEGRSLSGYERTRVLFNTGGRRGTFVEAGEAVGIDDTYDGRAVALADLDRDGDVDVVIANQNGPLLVYRNESELDHRWVAFDLVGASANTSAIGAEIEVEFAGGRQVQVLASATGFASQNERRLHFGLGAEPGPVRATVRWPSGAETVLADLELDKAHRVGEEQE